MSIEQILGLLTGIAFGFILQRARVLRYEKQIGAMLLQDMTILKFMLSSILVGMCGILLLQDMGIITLAHKSMNFGGVLIGFIAGGFSIAATNGGIGLYPIAVTAALALFDIPTEPASAFGWIMWTAQTAMVIVFGGLSFLLLPICNKAK
mgnify:CR=1 FL=1